MKHLAFPLLVAVVVPIYRQEKGSQSACSPAGSPRVLSNQVTASPASDVINRWWLLLKFEPLASLHDSWHDEYDKVRHG